ncbi:50S ribosomal protein L22 [Candidatus Saccharibacteria bacterium]|nr:50S ribosomal protein L22 [Candidatus Saccharibacteria bacterium]NCU40868.1 50S ribosomal protein L22 [Candidatus Saccharibacteria bacterium]
MAEKTTLAKLTGLRLAPRKVSLVAGLVRGRTVADALVILEHTPKRAAKPLAKLISSAKANAVSTHGMQEKDLLITTLSVTAGERLKRYRPAAHGRALPFVKASSNIRLVVSGTEKPKKKPADRPTKLVSKEAK